MHALLTKWLQKKGIGGPEDLSNQPLPDGTPSEKEIFERYSRILSKEELTISDVKEFCQAQLGQIEAKWKDLTIENTKKAELIPYFTVYRSLLSAIDSPKHIREAIEKQLEQLTQ